MKLDYKTKDAKVRVILYELSAQIAFLDPGLPKGWLDNINEAISKIREDN